MPPSLAGWNLVYLEQAGSVPDDEAEKAVLLVDDEVTILPDNPLVDNVVLFKARLGPEALLECWCRPERLSFHQEIVDMCGGRHRLDRRRQQSPFFFDFVEFSS